ncbi:MAG: hypothetical protein WBK91_01155 [Alphaproteobacteria bacterium]
MSLRLTNWLWIVLLLGASALLYHTSYQVQELQKQYSKLEMERNAEMESIHVLEAEWNYLTSPTRLQRLTEKYLALQPVMTAQILTRDTLARKLPARERSKNDLAALTATDARTHWYTRPDAPNMDTR